VDVDTNPDNPVIGDRAFGADPETVIQNAQAVLAGFRAGGVLSCLKHFPGHGDTLLDSHLALPTVAHDRARLEAVEIMPFRRLAGLADSVMTAHVVYPALDRGPATLSSSIVTGLLRESIGFSGVVFSDDLEMKGIAASMAPEAAGLIALEAGCDILLVCHDSELQARVHASLLERATSDATFRRRCVIAATRSLALRKSRPPAPGSTQALERILREEVEPLSAELQRRLA
jgi:beta-N-acetylhexosaminidase